VASNKLKQYYSLWVITGSVIVLLGILLSFKLPAVSIWVSLFIAYAASSVFTKNKKMGLIILCIAFACEFAIYNLLCSIWTGAICQRNLFTISAFSIFLFAILSLVIFLSVTFKRVTQNKKS
jgi:hypothetical protein